MIKLYTVFSGKLQQVGWEWNQELSRGEMIVIFKSGACYEYAPVPKALWDEFWSPGVESKGSWFYENIEKNPDIKYRKIEKNGS